MDAKLQPPGERARAVAGEIGEIGAAASTYSARCATSTPVSDEHHIVRPPLDQFDAGDPFQLADLHRKRRLGDGAGLGGLAEVPVRRQGGQISQLLKVIIPIR